MVWKRSQSAYGRTPEPTTPYQKAAQVWDERLGSARVQAKNWRLATLMSIGLSVVLAGGLLWQATQSLVTPYVVEIDTTGEVRGVTPTVKDFVPSDAQITFQLAEFIRHVRGVSTDPVVVRQNWLYAYDFATSQAAATLSDYATTNDPFAEVGVRSVAVDVQSVVRSSDATFEVRWQETEFRSGVKQSVSNHTAHLTIVTDPPRDEATLQRNPLGVYVHAIHWSQDRIKTGDAP
ncbi:MAG: conjugal transfer protein TrbF [Litorimonas sp.]|uniref:Conjugal transfer protein TrbF n=1 Tax=Algimonas ampicilliniresistens TaxID=1298735 RepID=A0ABQ5V8S3_9PROT|nr:conjugal transfer protein TrbF [Algimonas ampicilliniresistens]GLQ23848.1 conjugal transfer protein TrbF [Algimonas ampicilliniresistens]